MRTILSNYLKKMRRDAGLSQAEVSEALGYTSPQFVSNWERGLASPPSGAMSGLIKLYSIRPSEVIELYLTITRSRLEEAFSSGAVKTKRRGRRAK